ncbi:MAG: hypothetical protein OHK0039_09830 [Bacteroidia bacterium]
MKFHYIFTLLILLTAVGFSRVMGQTAEQVVTEAGEGLLKGEVDMLTKYFDEHVEINMMGDRKVHSKAQAQYVITRFFAEYDPSTFQMRQLGETNGGYFAYGDLECSRGLVTVNIYVRMTAQNYRINEIRFEPK